MGFFICIPMENKSDREHSFDIELAEIVGIQKAIILKNINYWVTENKRKKSGEYHKDGQWWTAESIRSLADKYKYMPRSSIFRWVNELEVSGWIVCNRFANEINFYRPGKVYEAWDRSEDWQSILESFEVSQNETPKKQVSQNGTGVSQNGTGVSQNGTLERPKMGHTNIDNIEEDIELNIESADAFFVTLIEGQTLEVGKHQKVAPAPGAPPAARAKKGKSGKESYDFRDIARHLEMKEQVFFTEILNAGLWQKWIEYKAVEKRQRYKSDKTAALCVKQLYNDSGANVDTLEQMINFSMAKLYDGVWSPPSNKISNTQNTIQKHQPTFEEMLGL